MANLTYSQIAQAAAAAGFTGNDLVTAVEVALAESDGNPAATNHNSNGSTDYGLFQINDKAHPDLITSNANWQDSFVNARMAYSVWTAAGKSWRPWTTYNTGAYLLQAGRINVATIKEIGIITPKMTPESGVLGAINQAGTTIASPIQAGANAVSSVVDTATSVADFLGKLSDPHTWVRAALVIVGGGLVVVALSIVAKPAVSPILSKTPVGKALL